MSEAFVIQIGHRTVGIAVRHESDFRFYSSDPEFFALEQQSFHRLRQIEQAAARVEKRRANSSSDDLLTSGRTGQAQLHRNH